MTYAIRKLVNFKPTGDIIAQSERLAEIQHLWQQGENAIVWNTPPREIRRLSPETLARVRALRHNRRVEKQVPLFAALFAKPVPPKK